MFEKQQLNKDNIIEDYLLQTNVYASKSFPNFDMREYASFVRKNGLSFKEITPEIMNMFYD